ncbi:GTPase IMAP family member 9-like [Tachysurus fulvidraco]|uniref:GTPase IMAP family member 9-like n=1 Tax=Tachysurus fulvidraco TaxID=1234273 RepID=UPI001FEFED58|nr:GTPase IMAP family member 9-like [Tachysurus fulvidraco]
MARHVSSKTDDAVSLGSSSLDEPKTDLRLVLLGGDCADNNYVAEIILGSDKKKETRNPKKGTVREASVDGRQLSVFVSPSYWMKHLDSFWFFSNGVESIRGELQNCTSVMFPGPHAFLLVMRAGQTTGKEHLLLKAITNVFGAEALEYTMVLFVYGNEWENPKDAPKNCCVKMCGTKYFMLENDEENVEELFRRVEAMKKSRFFIQRSYENLMKVYFEPWEKAQAYKEMRLKRELEELKLEQCQRDDELKTFRQTERDLREISRLSIQTSGECVTGGAGESEM